jgi:hypothetical protein
LVFLVGLPVLAPLVGQGAVLLPAWVQRLPGRAWAAGAILGLVLYASARVSLAGGLHGLGPYWDNAAYYPTQALADPQVRALLDDPRHRVLNYYTWGGYLIWEGVRPAIDGRQYLYGEPAMEQYVRLTRLGPGWQQLLDAQGIDLVLYPTEAGLTGALADRPAWQVVYADPLVTLYQRRASGVGLPTR